MSIVINNVSKTFGGFKALDNVNLEVPDGSLLALLGPSGSGKTTLLRIIAGLEISDSGTVIHQNEDITHHPARDRKVGFVFQHYALFRHMTVAENIGFGLRMRKVSKAQIDERVKELLRLIRLEGLGSRYPGQLSGGQRQRVALARSLAAQPKVLLLDEPFGALDAKVRQELRHWLRKLHKEIHVTSIFVTHDQEEALEVADKVVVMNEGRIEQIGTPEEVYDHPKTPFVYQFLGNVNLFHGRVHHGRALIGDIEVDAPEHADAVHTPAVAYVRPHDFEISKTRNGGGNSWLEATIDQLLAVGPVARLDLKRPGSDEPLQAEISRDQYHDLDLSEGDRIFIRPRRLKLFAGEERAAGS